MLLVALAACGVGERPELASDQAGAPAASRDASWAAIANVPELVVYATPDVTQPLHNLTNPDATGAALVFLVDGLEVDQEWLPVYLPVRPNGSKGWIQANDVTLRPNEYKLRIDLAAHTLTLSNAGELELETSIGVGTQDTPTPPGTYFLKELIQPPEPDGPYGPFAYGLSGFSDNPSMRNFNGGEGVIGIHGTNDPSSIGKDVSHGCIRVTNDVITQLAQTLPIGTPVEIS